MVKLGFIVEGDTEKIILEHSDLFEYLQSKSIHYIPDVIDAKGNGNLLPQNIEAFTKTLEDKGASHIIILTDLDEDRCITSTKTRISPIPDPQRIITIAVKTIESWFLADIEAMRNFLDDPAFVYNNNDNPPDPFEEIKRIRMATNNRGVSNKPILAKRMTRSGFSISKAANNSPSAKYFLDKINALAPITE